MKLRNYNTFPPGAFPYVQEVGIRRVFDAGGYSIEQQAKLVSDFRKGNSLPRPSAQEAFEDIEAYTCSRLNNDPAYCYEPGTAQTSVNPLLKQASPCAGCGAAVT